MRSRVESTSTSIRLVRGDITEQQVDAIVNAANSGLLGGGGVDGAIHRRGGPSILDECRHLRATSYPDGLPTGEAVATGAGDLPAQSVVHAVGPVWSADDADSPRLLASAYSRSLDEARRLNARTVAFPSISTGAFGYPVAEAADVAITVVSRYLAEHPDAFDEVRFVLFSDEVYHVFERAHARIIGTSP